MSNNPLAANSQPPPPLPSWTNFLSQTLPGPTLPQFPKAQLQVYLKSGSCPKLSELLSYLPWVQQRYSQDSSHFCQLILLLYLLMLKGCANATYGGQFVRLGLEVLEGLLRYRIGVVAGGYGGNCMAELYGWMDQWLGVMVPGVLRHMSMQKDKSSASRKDKQQPKSLISILTQLNKNNPPINPLLILFQSLLISKIRVNLSAPSLFQFDSILRRLYSEQKYKLVYQGKGCVSHLQAKDKERDRDMDRELLANDLIVISGLVPARVQENSWEVYDLQLRVQGKDGLKLRRVKSDLLMEQWVIGSFGVGSKPNPIRIDLHAFLNKKAMEMYRLLCQMEIYGSSPNIEVLDEYITDENLLYLFTKFLMGQNLAEYILPFLPSAQKSATKYSYKNQKLARILQNCMNEALKLQQKQQKSILIEQFRTKLMATTKNDRSKTETRQKIDDYLRK